MTHRSRRWAASSAPGRPSASARWGSRSAPSPPPSAESTAPPGATIVRQVPKLSEIEAIAAARAAAPANDPAAKDRRRLALLLEVSKGLGRATDLDTLLGKIVDSTFQVLEADRCAILLADADGALVPKLSRDRRGQEAGGDVPQSILRTALDEQVAILSDDAAQDARFTGKSVVLQKVRSAMCVPLLDSAGCALGVLYVDNFSLTRFGEADLDLLIAFAGIAAVSLENGQLAERIRREALARSNFERFFTPQLAARIASSPEAVTLGGEKRPVAILFSDIRGVPPRRDARQVHRRRGDGPMGGADRRAGRLRPGDAGRARHDDGARCAQRRMARGRTPDLGDRDRAQRRRCVRGEHRERAPARVHRDR